MSIKSLTRDTEELTRGLSEAGAAAKLVRAVGVGGVDQPPDPGADSGVESKLDQLSRGMAQLLVQPPATEEEDRRTALRMEDAL